MNGKSSKEKIKDSFCIHNKNCKVCLDLKGPLSTCSYNKIKIAQEVKESGRYNFEGCKIPVNEKIDTEFMKKMLVGYADIQVCELMKFGFPIDLEIED